MILLIGSVLALTAFTIVFRLGWRVLRFWRIVREEALLHLAFMFFYIGALIIGIILLALSIFVIQPRSITYRDFVLTFGAFYDFIYLEFSFMYLALFSNSRRFIDKYFPLLIGGPLTLTLVLPLVQSESLVLPTLILHGVAILTGISLIIQLYLRIKANEIYFQQEEQEFIQLLKKLTLGLFLVSLPDGLGFLALLFLPFEITEYVFLLLVIIAVGSSIIGNYLLNLLAEKGKKIDFTHFFNTIS